MRIPATAPRVVVPAIGLALVLLAGFEWRPLAQSSAQSAVEPTPPRWTGTATGEMRRTGVGAYVLPALGTEPGGPANQSGDVVTTWKASIRLKEDTPIDVKDSTGAVVGQLVPLRDDGSTVTMSIGGRMTERNPYGDIEHWDYSGTDVAPEPAIVAARGGAFATGWIYRSSSSPDPLADLLPDGSYSLSASPTVVGGFSVRVTRLDVGHTDQPHEHTMATGGTGAWMAGWSLWGWAALAPSERAKHGGGDGMSITVDAVRRALTATEPVIKTLTDANPRTYVIRDSAMDGTLAQRVRVDLTERLLVSSRWRLERRLPIAATLSRVSRSWRPTRDGLVTAKAALDPALGLTGRFRFTLSDVSRERGYAINAGSGTDPDLAFAAGQAGFGDIRVVGGGWQIETTGASAAAQVTLVSADYGAWGRLTAEVNVDAVWYDCDAEGGGSDIRVPRDDDGDRIADGWEELWGATGTPAAEDADEQPAPTNATDVSRRAGDGLSLYEEYRGFLVGQQWRFGYPGQKDVFVFDELALGVGVFPATGLRIHLINDDEYDTGRVVNYNRGHATAGPQKGLRLMDRKLGEDIGGQVHPTVGTPNTVEWVGIDTSKDTFFAFGATFDGLVAHELGHAVNMPHHGDPSSSSRICTDTPIFVARPGGQYSGVWNCVMRYNTPLSYEGWDGVCHPAPAGGPRTMFCRSKAGTEMNAGPKRTEGAYPLPMAGDATVGACLDHLMIRGTSKNGR